MVTLKAIRSWRIQSGSPRGLHLWWDPDVETVLLIKEKLPDPESCDSVIEMLIHGSVSGASAADSNVYREDPEGLADQEAQRPLPLTPSLGESHGA